MGNAGGGQRRLRPAQRAVDIGVRMFDRGHRQRLAEQTDEPPRLLVYLAAFCDIVL
jgi:hypothetical protein